MNSLRYAPGRGVHWFTMRRRLLGALISAADPTDLERLVAGATRLTLPESGAAQVALKLSTPKER
jgi:hypothetical protein